MTRSADLHIHTFYSDGSDSPEQVVEESCHAGISCIAITDHDTVSGVSPTRAAAASLGLEVISGIELSSEIQGKDIHILGYFIDCGNEILLGRLQQFRLARLARIEAMIGKLKEQGIDNITLEEVQSVAPSDAVGRPHLASLLIKKKWAANPWEAFAKFLGEDCPAYVPKFQQSPCEAIALIRQAGGVAVLAHPMTTNKDELIAGFVEAGLGGIEVYYPNYTNAVINYYEGIAKKYRLAMTGGSDAHGKVKDNTWIGKRRIPYELVEQLRGRAETQK